MSGHAGGHSLGGRAERQGTKGYAAGNGLEETPLRDGHNPEPDVPTGIAPNDPADLGQVNTADDAGGAARPRSDDATPEDLPDANEGEQP